MFKVLWDIYIRLRNIRHSSVRNFLSIKLLLTAETNSYPPPLKKVSAPCWVGNVNSHRLRLDKSLKGYACVGLLWRCTATFCQIILQIWIIKKFVDPVLSWCRSSRYRWTVDRWTCPQSDQSSHLSHISESGFSMLRCRYCRGFWCNIRHV